MLLNTFSMHTEFILIYVCAVMIFLRLQTSELGVTEHVEGDPCKFALWVGRTPSSDNKTVLKVHYSLHFNILFTILLEVNYF